MLQGFGHVPYRCFEENKVSTNQGNASSDMSCSILNVSFGATIL
jgi:hypothetical protein